MREVLKPWQIYEQAAREILMNLREYLGISEVTAAAKLQGMSGTIWRVDARAALSGSEGFLIIEARRHTTNRQKQEDVAALAYRVKDVNASGAVIVTPLPLQVGASILATHENVHHVRLEAWSTAEHSIAEFMGRVVVKKTETFSVSDQVEAEVLRDGKRIE